MAASKIIPWITTNPSHDVNARLSPLNSWFRQLCLPYAKGNNWPLLKSSRQCDFWILHFWKPIIQILSYSMMNTNHVSHLDDMHQGGSYQITGKEIFFKFLKVTLTLYGFWYNLKNFLMRNLDMLVSWFYGWYWQYMSAKPYLEHTIFL